MKLTYKLTTLFLFCTISAAIAQPVTNPSTTSPQAPSSAPGSTNFAALEAYKRFNQSITQLAQETKVVRDRLSILNRDWAGLKQTLEEELNNTQKMFDLFAPNGEIANAMREWLARAQDLRRRSEAEHEQSIVDMMDKQIQTLQNDLQRLPQLHERAQKLIEDLRAAQGQLGRLKEAQMIEEAGTLTHRLTQNMAATLDAGEKLRDELKTIRGPGT